MVQQILKNVLFWQSGGLCGCWVYNWVWCAGSVIATVRDEWPIQVKLVATHTRGLIHQIDFNVNNSQCPAHLNDQQEDHDHVAVGAGC